MCWSLCVLQCVCFRSSARLSDVSSLSYVCFVGVDLCLGRFLRGYFLRCDCCGLKEFLHIYSLQGMHIVFDDIM